MRINVRKEKQGQRLAKCESEREREIADDADTFCVISNVIFVCDGKFSIDTLEYTE